MKDTKLHIVGLEHLDEQCRALAAAHPHNADFVNKGWFFIYCYKVLLCPKRYSHDWGACPYAHANESARRRDPQRYSYSSCICPNTGKGECPHGEQCRYAHTLFEYWLHPARFRTQMCKAGANCKRALCFFAHSHAELRQPDKAQDSLAQSSVVQLASAAAALAGGAAAGQMDTPVGGLNACGGPQVALQLDSNGALAATGVGPAALAAISTGFESSSSSNISCGTCQQGSSPLALTTSDFSNGGSGEFGSRGVHGGRLPGSCGSLPLQAAPVTAGLLAQIAQQQQLQQLQPNSLLAAGAYPAVSTVQLSSGLVNNMQMDLLQQRQQQQREQQQQQQLVAGMAAMGLSQGPTTLDQLQPSAFINQLVVANSSGILTGPVPAAAGIAGPVYSVVQGMPAAAAAMPNNFVGPATCAALQQQQQVAPLAVGGLQQVYLTTGGQPVQGAPGLQYAWI